MGSLKPGATYIYEKANGVTYAREFGADPSTRQVVGWDYDHQQQMHQQAFEASIQPYVNKGNWQHDSRTSDGRPLHDHMMEGKMWGEIHRMAKTNPTLQKALDRAIMIYRLSKDKPL
jgi:hypothetical protein